MLKNKSKLFFQFILIISLFISFTHCAKKVKKMDPNRPLTAEEKRKKFS